MKRKTSLKRKFSRVLSTCHMKPCRPNLRVSLEKMTRVIELEITKRRAMKTNLKQNKGKQERKN